MLRHSAQDSSRSRSLAVRRRSSSQALTSSDWSFQATPPLPSPSSVSLLQPLPSLHPWLPLPLRQGRTARYPLGQVCILSPSLCLASDSDSDLPLRYT